MRNGTDMKNWISLGGDVDWSGVSHLWGRKAKDGSWYVLRFNNMWDSISEDSCKRDGIAQYECDVKRLVLTDVDLDSALRSCGLLVTSEGLGYEGSGDVIDPQYAERAVVEACIGHGFGAPLETFTAETYPERVRAQARRYAEECMRDADLREERLDRPVNAIMTSAEAYGRGEFGLRWPEYDAHVKARTYHLLKLAS